MVPLGVLSKGLCSWIQKKYTKSVQKDTKVYNEFCHTDLDEIEQFPFINSNIFSTIFSLTILTQIEIFAPVHKSLANVPISLIGKYLEFLHYFSALFCCSLCSIFTLTLC